MFLGWVIKKKTLWVIKKKTLKTSRHGTSQHVPSANFKMAAIRRGVWIDSSYFGVLVFVNIPTIYETRVVRRQHSSLAPEGKFLKSRSKSKVKVTRSKVKVSNERSHHKESTCEIWKLYYLRFKRYSQG